MENLQIISPEQLIYENDLLRFTVLGGIKLGALSNMRATLKAEIPDTTKPALRHNLDLYNDNQVEKYVKRCAEKLELGLAIIESSVSELVNQLEKYRLTHLENQTETTTHQIHILTHEEKESAKKYLSSSKLIERTKKDLQSSGIIGEEINSLILYLGMTSRKCPNPISVICLAKSGSGKSYLQERVAACMPEEDLLETTQFTENSFYYYDREELRGKIFLIEDLDGAENVLYPIRELQSKKRISKRVVVKDPNGNTKTQLRIVEGPISVIGATTQEKIYEDNANRSILIYLDNSEKQDKNIQNYQRNLSAGLINKKQEKTIQQQLRDVQHILEPIKIINPYAPLIDLPSAVFKPRRTLSLLLHFIEAVTFYHQYQRQKQKNETGEIYIVSTPEDIAIAFDLLSESLFQKSDELSGACRSFYEQLCQMKFKENYFTARMIREQQRINPRTLQHYLQELTAYHYLNITGGKKHHGGYQYQINKAFTAQKMKSHIHQHLEEIMKKIRASVPVSKSTQKRKVA